jgi:5-methylcytosine-specific restriction enzyme subunit McrC
LSRSATILSSNRERDGGEAHSNGLDQRFLKTLSVSVPENIAIKEGLISLNSWLHNFKPKDPLCVLSGKLLEVFAGVRRWHGPIGKLMEDMLWRVNALPSHQAYYREALWTAYVLLQKMLPDVGVDGLDGLVSLGSMIVDVSKVFESFARRILEEAAPCIGVRVYDGNKAPSRFFIDNSQFSVHPDIILRQDGNTIAILDVKYKPYPKESDRYEILSFLEATNARKAIFICPVTSAADISQYLGKTFGNREMSIIRINLAADNLSLEESKFIRNVKKVLGGDYSFEQ